MLTVIIIIMEAVGTPPSISTIRIIVSML